MVVKVTMMKWVMVRDVLMNIFIFEGKGLVVIWKVTVGLMI